MKIENTWFLLGEQIDIGSFTRENQVASKAFFPSIKVKYFLDGVISQVSPKNLQPKQININKRVHTGSSLPYKDVKMEKSFSAFFHNL